MTPEQLEAIYQIGKTAHENGIHSRDKEIEELKAEIERLKNPWIYDRLPSTKEDSPSGYVFALCVDSYDLDDTHGSMTCLMPALFVYWNIDKDKYEWSPNVDTPYELDDIYCWMPIPERKENK